MVGKSLGSPEAGNGAEGLTALIEGRSMSVDRLCSFMHQRKVSSSRTRSCAMHAKLPCHVSMHMTDRLTCQHTSAPCGVKAAVSKDP